MSDDVGLTFRTSYRFSGITETTSRQILPEFWCRLGHGHIGNLPQNLNMYLVYIHIYIYIYVIMDRYKTHQTQIHVSHPSWHLKYHYAATVYQYILSNVLPVDSNEPRGCHSFFPSTVWSNKRSTHRQSWAEQPCDSTPSAGTHNPQKKFMKYTNCDTIKKHKN